MQKIIPSFHSKRTGAVLQSEPRGPAKVPFKITGNILQLNTPPEFFRGDVLVQTSWTNYNLTRTGLSPLDFLQAPFL